jgi:cell wall assembly regulator SMI1
MRGECRIEIDQMTKLSMDLGFHHFPRPIVEAKMIHDGQIDTSTMIIMVKKGREW